MIKVTKVPAKPTPADVKKTWFVRFKFLHDGKEVTCKAQRGINYYKKFNEKVQKFEKLKQAVEDDLKNGWNPVTNSYPSTGNPEGFNESLDFALTKGSWSQTTKRNYTGTINFVKQAAVDLGISNQRVSLVKRAQIKQLLEYIQKKRKWSNFAYNKNLGYLKAVMSQLIEWEMIEYNPAHKIKSLPVAETRKYVPLTQKEKEAIRNHLLPHHFRYFTYLMVIYQTGIRPKEVLALQIKDIDFAGRMINILPDLEEENSKTKTIRRVPIGNHLLPLLEALSLKDYPADFYAFGSPFTSGRGNSGSTAGKVKGSTRPDYFIPSLTRIKRDTTTKLWNTLIMQPKNKGGLGINKHQYALKHTGADDKILAGIDIEVLKDLYGHTSKNMTEKYVTVLKAINARKIMDNSPDF